MRMLLITIAVSSTPALAETRFSVAARYEQRTESSPLYRWLPGVTFRVRPVERVSLSLDVGMIHGKTFDAVYAPFLPVDARRSQLPVSLGVMVHAPRGVYVIAGAGETHEQLSSHPFGDGLDSASSWRPHAFLGAGVERRCARDRVSFGLEVRGFATGGTAPTDDFVMHAPTFSTYALEAALTFTVHHGE